MFIGKDNDILQVNSVLTIVSFGHCKFILSLLIKIKKNVSYLIIIIK